jgi:MFS transporter, Spinster family, sphingosine-1-phosphate transporter
MDNMHSNVPKKVFILLCGINLFNYIDRQILYSVFPLIKIDLNLSDTQLGLIASAFMFVYMLYAPLSGYFGDRTQRQKWIGISTIIWSVATLFSGISKSYAQFFGARMSVGVGEAGYTAIAPSYLVEHFPDSKRAKIMSFFMMALPIGSAIGYLLGGYLGQTFGWRTAFYMVGAPGLVLGLMTFSLKDDLRLPDIERKFPSLKNYLSLFKNKIYLLTSLSQAAVTFTLGGLAVWMPTYFHRYFDLSVAQAGVLFGGLTVFAGTIGTFMGGFLADYFRKRNDKAYFIVSLASLMLSLPVASTAVLISSKTMAIGLFFIAELLVFVPNGPLNAALIEAVPIGIRSMAFALNIFIIHALGDAVSPALIGVFSDKWGLKSAILICILALVFALGFNIVSVFTKYAKTETT